MIVVLTSTVQYSIVMTSTVQYSDVLTSTGQYSIVLQMALKEGEKNENSV